MQCALWLVDPRTLRIPIGQKSGCGWICLEAKADKLGWYVDAGQGVQPGKRAAVSLKKGWWVRCWNGKTGWWWKLMLCCCFEGEEGWIKMSNCRNVGTLRQMVIVVLFLLLFCLQHYHMFLATSSAIFSCLLRSFNCCVSCVCCVRCPELNWFFCSDLSEDYDNERAPSGAKRSRVLKLV